MILGSLWKVRFFLPCYRRLQVPGKIGHLVDDGGGDNSDGDGDGGWTVGGGGAGAGSSGGRRW